MISELEIVGFKRFEKQRFEIAPLTVLAGMNGAGKTSLIHALLLVAEASRKTADSVVSLNGPYDLELGTAEDIRNWASSDVTQIRFSHGGGNRAEWHFQIPAGEALYLEIANRPSVIPAAFSGEPRAFTYLCAERLGPKSILNSSPIPDAALEVGVRGAYCGQVIAALGSKPLANPDRRHPESLSSESSLLKYEVERWLGEISRPVEIDAIRYSGSIISALKFRSPGSEWVRATNMGFGVSYALPVVLGGLLAKAGGLFIVENPEAHLHPAGQSRMGVFLAWLASKGVQVIVETHSDHVVNGIRRAVGEHKYLDSGKAIVQFFESGSSTAPTVQALQFTALGGISHWPNGFFDQYQIDVQSLGKIRRESRTDGIRS